MEAATPIKVCETCRRIRLATVFCFLISTLLAGFFWAHVELATSPRILMAAIALSVLSALLILAVEIVVTKTEIEAKTLFLHLKAKAEEVRLLQEKINHLERSIDLLAKDDEDVREKLLNLSIQTSERVE
jgi:hypothetical protein